MNGFLARALQSHLRTHPLYCGGRIGLKRAKPLLWERHGRLAWAEGNPVKDLYHERPLEMVKEF